jgi:hypothetical protein
MASAQCTRGFAGAIQLMRSGSPKCMPVLESFVAARTRSIDSRAQRPSCRCSLIHSHLLNSRSLMQLRSDNPVFIHSQKSSDAVLGNSRSCLQGGSGIAKECTMLIQRALVDDFQRDATGCDFEHPGSFLTAEPWDPARTAVRYFP